MAEVNGNEAPKRDDLCKERREEVKDEIESKDVIENVKQKAEEDEEDLYGADEEELEQFARLKEKFKDDKVEGESSTAENGINVSSDGSKEGSSGSIVEL